MCHHIRLTRDTLQTWHVA